MARPREFDEAAVLDAAIARFWQHGYEATSVRDLADEMNIAGASLYNAFGDKRTLYEHALNRYLDQSFRERIRRLEPGLPPREAIVAFLQEIVKRSLTDKQRRGCMLVNSAIESAPHDDKFFDIVATFLDEVEQFFFRCVSSGQKDGTITKANTAEDICKSLKYSAWHSISWRTWDPETEVARRPPATDIWIIGRQSDGPGAAISASDRKPLKARLLA